MITHEKVNVAPLRESILLLTLPAHGHLRVSFGFIKRYSPNSKVTIVVPKEYLDNISRTVSQAFPDMTVSFHSIEETVKDIPKPYTLLSYFKSTLAFAHGAKKFLGNWRNDPSQVTVMVDYTIEYLLDRQLLRKFDDIRIMHPILPLDLRIIRKLDLSWRQIFGEVRRWPKVLGKAILMFRSLNKKFQSKIHLWNVQKIHDLPRYIFTTQDVVSLVKQMEPRMNLTAIWPIVEWSEEVTEDISRFLSDHKQVVFLSLGTIFNNDLELFKKLIDRVDLNEPLVIMCPKELIQGIIHHTSGRKAVFIAAFVPQLYVLRHSKLFITHAGFSGLNQSIYYKVPMWMVPTTFEAVYNAKLAEQLGHGIILSV